MYRAYRLLEEHDIGLSELVSEGGWSKTTWSRFLRARLDPEPEGIRRSFEKILRGRDIPAPPDLWQPAKPGSEDPTNEGEITMRGQSLRDDARLAYKLFRNPFDPDALVEPDGRDHLHDLYLPPGHKFAEARLLQALTGAGFVALYGEPTSGKSLLYERARRTAAERKPLAIVRPANIERRKMTAMHIAAEIIRQLSEESVPRTANIRDAKAVEVLKQRYLQGQRVALVIDEAHELPDNTLKDLKRYHEASDSYLRLLAVILIGQTELAQRFESDRNFRLREVIARCQLIHLRPMEGKGDVRRYMETRFGWVGGDLDTVWEAEAVEELERRLAEHSQQLPGIIGNVATGSMNLAFTRTGGERVTADDVIDVMSASTAQLRAWGLA